MGIFQLFDRILKQYNKLRQRNAFLDQYKKEAMFKESFEEFDDAKYIDDVMV